MIQGSCVQVVPGTNSPIDDEREDPEWPIGGCCGRVKSIDVINGIVFIDWDSFSLRGFPIEKIEEAHQNGFVWTGIYLRLSDVVPCKARDAAEDANKEIQAIETRLANRYLNRE